MMISKNFNYLNKLLNLFLSLSLTLATIGLWSIVTLNFTPLYKISIKAFDITTATSLTEGQLMSNYKVLIKYLQSPSIHKLKFLNFPMSAGGETHFADVKSIFIYLHIITWSTIILFAVLFVFKKKYLSKEIFKIFNHTFYILSIFSITILILVLNNFDKTFENFHKLFFSNDLWLFDPATDPVINALPENFFMVCGITIIALTLIQVIILKVIYQRHKKANTFAKRNIFDY
ncbi:TIGR01906 family membrane protein [Clostridium manihotivorum]|uniref:TIGR01906 family membrane protein n=1 Tax=Clostridium manihotivorum TaxID=2320868 RepID=A0A410DQ35_9CLOT|nr:TIGR01906 family membrane protein [Clostridium manihotivorum]QAA31157.1 TIGR01906 family membrane protein [Clostridium manihotivorum]